MVFQCGDVYLSLAADLNARLRKKAFRKRSTVERIGACLTIDGGTTA